MRLWSGLEFIFRLPPMFLAGPHFITIKAKI